LRNPEKIPLLEKEKEKEPFLKTNIDQSTSIQNAHFGTQTAYLVHVKN